MTLLLEFIGALFRFALTGVGAWLVAKGVITPDQSTRFLNAAVLGLAMMTTSLLWSLWQKYKSRLKFIASSQLPAWSSEEEAQSLAKTAAIKGQAFTAVVLALLVVGSMSACASVDSFNRTASRLTADAITITEQNRCEVHAAPCLTDAQFKSANVSLYKVSVAGEEFMKLRIAWKSTTADVSTFLSTVAEETSALSKAFPDGPIGKALAKLAELQQRASKLLGS